MSGQTAETAEHAISVFFDRDTLCMEAVCHADVGARCRLTCDHDCESWREPYEVDGVWMHDIEGYSGNVIATHGMRDAGYCNVVEFINNGDAEECAHSSVGRIELATVPIKPVWEGDYYQWRPLSLPPASTTPGGVMATETAHMPRLTPEVLAGLRRDNEAAKRNGWRGNIGVDDVDLLLDAAEVVLSVGAAPATSEVQR